MWQSDALDDAGFRGWYQSDIYNLSQGELAPDFEDLILVLSCALARTRVSTWIIPFRPLNPAMGQLCGTTFW